MARGIASKHPNLTILDFTEGAAILSRDPHGVLALLDEACLIEHQDAIGITQCVSHELMVVPQHLLFIPTHITDKPLHPTDGAPLDVEGHRLDGLAFELAEFAHHIVQEMGARLTPPKTVVKG